MAKGDAEVEVFQINAMGSTPGSGLCISSLHCTVPMQWGTEHARLMVDVSVDELISENKCEEG